MLRTRNLEHGRPLQHAPSNVKQTLGNFLLDFRSRMRDAMRIVTDEIFYIHCDIAPGTTLAAHRRERPIMPQTHSLAARAARRRALLNRMRRNHTGGNR